VTGDFFAAGGKRWYTLLQCVQMTSDSGIRRHAPTVLFIGIAILTLVGIAMLYSTTSGTAGERLVKRQVIYILLGISMAVVVSRLDYRMIGRYSTVLLILISIPLLYLAALFLMYKLDLVPSEILKKAPLTKGGDTKGAFRWLSLGPVNAQPSEFAKIVLIVFLANYYMTNHRYAGHFKRGVLYPMLIVGPIAAAILLSGSLSITAITCAVVMGILFVAGVRLRYFLLFAAIGAALFGAVLKASPERMSRMTTYKEPEKHRQSDTYQLYHSQLAISLGGISGAGFNKSRMKEYYLPESHTDFILAIVGEELGFVAVLSIMLLYMAVMGAAFLISADAVDREGMLLAFGVGLSIGLHAFANMGVVSGFLPTTGVTAPLISYGGSSMIVTWVGIGLLASVARIARLHPKEELSDTSRRPMDSLFDAQVLSAATSAPGK
jgi:cell division protein FtsW